MRYTGPKGRINRAVGAIIYENTGAVKAFNKRETPPGMHGTRRSKKSEYGLAMLEKKKLKHFYGLHERQLRRFLELAQRSPQNTSDELLVLCERRLDNVIRRAGLAKTRPQARQGVHHGHFRVNGRRVTIPSYLTKPGDVISVVEKAPIQAIYRTIVASDRSAPPGWLDLETSTCTAKVLATPSAADAGLPVEMSRVIVLLSR
jgi:small subunit ribosomal protein S4